MDEGLPRKLIVRLPVRTYVAIESLGEKTKLCHADNRIRYAEITRLLLVHEILRDQPVDVRIAAAVLVNSTMILAAEFARLTYDLQGDLEALATRATGADGDLLVEARSGTGKKARRRGKDVQPVVHLTLDGWLAREIAARARSTNLTGSGYRSPTAYVVANLLRDVMTETDVLDLVSEYATAVRNVRSALERAVAGQRDAIRRRLKTSKI
jgi:hypothetical protein